MRLRVGARNDENYDMMEKAEMRKYIILTIIILFMSIGLVACRSKEDPETGTDASQSQKSQSQSTEYRKLSIVIPDDITAKDFVMTEAGVKLLTNEGIINLNYNGEMDEEIPLSGSENFTHLSIDRSEIFHILALSHNEEGNIESLTVHQFKSDGAKLPRTALKGSFAELEATPLIGDFLTVGGYYYVQSMYGVYVYDRAGELVLMVREEHETTANSLFSIEDGRVASVSTRNRDNTSLAVVRFYEPDASDFEEHIINMTAISSETINLFDGGAGLLIVENSELHEYAPTTGRGDMKLNFLNHGVDPAMLIGLSQTQDGDIVCILARDSAWLWGRTPGEVVVFSKRLDHVMGTIEAHRAGDEAYVETGPPKEKETVTIMIMEMESQPRDWLRERVALFNKSNPNYNVEVRTYTFTDANDVEDARRRFIIDVAHDPADIIYLSGGFHEAAVPIRSYARKGVFADLYEIMDNDPGFKKDDYLPNLFTALEIDGRLYDIAAGFTIELIAGKASDFVAGEKPSWTIDEFISFIDKKPEAEYIIESYTKESFISTMIEYYFTDRETGEVKFNREAFHKILEVSERFPMTEPPDEGGDDWFHFRSGARDGNPLLLYNNLLGYYAFRDLMTQEVAFFGETIIFKGFPSAEGTGIQFRIPARFAISQKSSNKNGAWEFIKFAMEVHPSLKWEVLYIHPKISRIEEMLEETMLNPGYYEDIPYYEIIGGRGQPLIRIPIGNNTPEMNKKIMDLIKSTTVVVPSDPVVRGIIREEIGAYLAGQKTPDQIADIIENRVGIYLKELE